MAEEETDEEDDNENKEENEDIDNKEDKHDDNTLRMGDRMETNPVGPWMASFDKSGSPALDRILH